MRKAKSRFLATLLIIIMLSGMVTLTASAASETVDIDTKDAGQIQTNIQNALTNVGDGGTVNVIGSATINTTLTLNIAEGKTINWQVSSLSGTVSNAPLIRINGGGTFNIFGTLVNNYTNASSTTITVSEPSRATVNVESGGRVNAGGTSGNAILVSANNVTINVAAGGTVESLSANTTAAIQVGAVGGVTINSAGNIISDGNSGYPIYDYGTSTNIIISDGEVRAGNTCAIRSYSSPPTIAPTNVTITGDSEVRNAGGATVSATINVGGNVSVSGRAHIHNDSEEATAYAIQTSGNVTVSGNACVESKNGRTINLVGQNSVATVNDNATVLATGSGAAICTATTNPESVINAGVVINGGTVSAKTGSAIRITGDNSYVRVNGGIVKTESGNGNAIQVGFSGDPATNATVTVSGGTVQTTGTGYAIRVLYGDANRGRILITDTRGSSDGGGDVDRGGQVAVFRTGAAINTPGRVTVNGGFVFAYGTSPTTAISAAGGLTGPSPNYGVVAVWDSPGGPYQYGTSDDLTPSVGSTTWGVDAEGTPGINYVNTGRGATLGFFPLADIAEVALLNYQLTVTVNPEAGGTTGGHGTGPQAMRSLINVSANANPGYHFTGWTVEGVSIEGGALVKPAIFIMPENAVTLTANFAPNPPDTYTLNVLGNVGGTVSGTRSGAYTAGQAINVTAEANDGWHFTGWTVTGSTLIEGPLGKPARFAMPENAVTLTANFEQNPVYPVQTYTLNVLGCICGTVSGTGSGAYAAGHAVNVTAVPHDGWRFSHWTINGAAITGGNTANPAVFTMPANAVTIKAEFVSTESAPPTGDNRNLILPIAMLALALTTITGAEIYRRTKKKASQK